MSEADASLGKLHGLSLLMWEPSIFIGPLMTKEALFSSQIEGTQTSLTEVFESAVNHDLKDEESAEVQRYVEASKLAFELVKDLPITQRLLSQVHKRLLQGVRGQEKNPGEFRRSPVWIGHAGATPTTATFVPPLPEHVPHLMGDWERFVNAEGNRLPVLVQAALMHYQFETIHPFLDGNGRIGRLVINLLFHERGRLDLPLLCLSGFFEHCRRDYYECLQNVRERGDIRSWLLFFFNAVQHQAEDATARATKLIELREKYHKQALRQRGKLRQLVDVIIENPIVTTQSVQEELKLTNQGARNLIAKAASEEINWLQPKLKNGKGGKKVWIAVEVLDILEGKLQFH